MPGTAPISCSTVVWAKATCTVRWFRLQAIWTAAHVRPGLESVAHSKGYVRPDNIGCTGSNDCDADTLTVDVDLLQALTHDLNATNPPDPVVISDDAGRFLCEFTLFQSLNLARRSRRPLSLFFHVPPGHVEASTELIKRSLVYLARHVGTL